MSVYELYPFDATTAAPIRILSSGQLLLALPRIGRGTPAVKFLLSSDNLSAAEIKRGFDEVAVPETDMPPGVRALRVTYEEMLDRSIVDMRYMRMFMMFNSHMGDEGVLDFLRTSGIDASPLVHPPARPFSNEATVEWDRINAGPEGYWGLLRSGMEQGGRITATMLHNLLGLQFPVYVAIQIHTFTQDDAFALLRIKDAAVQFTQRSTAEKAHRADKAGQGTHRLRDEMATGGAMHTANLFVLVGAQTSAELDVRMANARQALPFRMDTVSPPGELVERMFSADLIPLRATDGWVTGTLGATLVSGSALSYRRRTNTRGIMLGYDAYQAPVVVWPWDSANRLPSYNEVILGATGSGKSFLQSLKTTRALMCGVSSIMYDITGNIDLRWLNTPGQEPVVERFQIGGVGGARLGFLKKTYEDLPNQIEMAMAFLRLFGVYRERQSERPVLDEALMRLYEPRWHDPDAPEPIMADLERELKHVAQKAATITIRRVAEELAYECYPYVHGSLRELFGETGNVDTRLNAPITIYDLKGLPDPISGPTLRAAMLGKLTLEIDRGIDRRRAAGDTSPISWFMDEVGIMFRDQWLAAFASAKYKTSRARLVQMTVADQDLPSFLGPRDEHGMHHGMPILSASVYRYLFNQPGNDLDQFRQIFPEIPEDLAQRVMAMPVGECVFMMPGDIMRLFITPTALDRVVLSSRLQDRQRAREVMTSLAAALPSAAFNPQGELVYAHNA